MKPRTHAERMRDVQPERPEDRPNRDARGYDRAWKRLRLWFLKRNPMCCHPGCDQPATVVDHRTAIASGGARMDPANLQALCATHHGQKTVRQDGGFGRRGKT